MRFMCLLGGACNGDHVINRHHHVGNNNRLDRAEELRISFDMLFLTIVIRQDQLVADPEQEAAADHLKEGEIQQEHSEGDQDHTQNDGASRTPENTLGSLILRQIAARKSDHHRVVTAEQDVDHDDLTDRSPMHVCKYVNYPS